jgi:hypothetical protein
MQFPRTEQFAWQNLDDTARVQPPPQNLVQSWHPCRRISCRAGGSARQAAQMPDARRAIAAQVCRSPFSLAKHAAAERANERTAALHARHSAASSALETPHGMGCRRLSRAPGGGSDRLAAHAVPHRDVVRAVLAEGPAERTTNCFTNREQTPVGAAGIQVRARESLLLLLAVYCGGVAVCCALLVPIAIAT